MWPKKGKAYENTVSGITPSPMNNNDPKVMCDVSTTNA